MADLDIPLLLNHQPVILVEDNFVCPERPIYINVFGKIKPNFVPVEYKAIGLNIQKGDKVALKKDRRRLVGDKFINKPEGRTRFVIGVRDYNIAPSFDESANRVVRGSKAPCTPYPAIRTTQIVTIAEGTFNIGDLTFKKIGRQ
jgi:hypothetical protein